MLSRRELLGAAVLAGGSSLAYSKDRDVSVKLDALKTTLSSGRRSTELSNLCKIVPRIGAPRLPEIAQLDSDGIAACWKVLFRGWQSVDKYRFFLLDLPQPLSINQQTADLYTEMAKNDNLVEHYHLPLVGDVKNATIAVTIPKSMQNVPANSPLAQQYCVILDGIGATVPEVAAHVSSAGFAAGLACRLSLQYFVKDPGGIPIFGVTDKQVGALKNATVTTRGAQEWNAFVARIMQAAPFEAAGIFSGWQAGGELSSLTGADVKFREATWKLLKSRFSWDEIGELCGYALSYITGYLRCQAVLTKFSNQRQAFSTANVVAAMNADDNIQATEMVLSTLYGNLVSQLIAVSESDHTAGQRFQQVLIGFQRGQLRASGVVFQQALSVGYGIGYRDGFQDGYARGYADGYRDGYDAADNSDWFSALSDVAKIVGAVAQIVAYCAA